MKDNQTRNGKIQGWNISQLW